MYVECAAWLPLAAAKKTLWAQAERDGWDTLPLLFKLTPWSIVVLSVLVPVIDPPGKQLRTHSTAERPASSCPVMVETTWCTVA